MSEEVRETRLLLHDADADDLASLEGYRRRRGYRGLHTALTEMEPGDVLEEIQSSGVRGRGGAGFPMGKKASFIPRDDVRKFVACNADESEPGTFKDRELMQKNPHQLIEGCVIAAYATGARYVYVYIRGEYDEQADVLAAALVEARDANLVGEDILGSRYSCHVVVHRGAGAYICGEETALLDSLEGKRGNPRLKPPFPAVAGVYDEPTLINNVETLANVPHIIRMGGDWYAQFGTEQSPGTKLVSVSGNVRRPGNYEIELGMSCRDLIFGLAGGPPEARELKCFFPGGSSSPVLVAEHLELPYTFEDISEAGSMLGSGGVIVVDDAHSIVELALRTAQFYKHESCGKCSPCREGTNWTVKLLQRMLAGEADPQDLQTLRRIQDGIMGNCLCVLGDSMAMPIGSMLDHFASEFEATIALGPRPELPGPADVAPPGPIELATGEAR